MKNPILLWQRWPRLKYFRNAAGAELIRSGTNYFDALRRLIEEARSEIHLQVYIFKYDAAGKDVMAWLLAAAFRGVKVFLVIDAFGSADFPEAAERLLKDNGIQVKRFSPVISFRGMQLGRRLHHKILCVDGKAALTGGINIADKYRGRKLTPPWLDFAVLLRGEICQGIRHVCLLRWRRMWSLHSATPNPISLSDDALLVRLCENDWLRGKHRISSGYKQAIRHAQTSIIMVASYFLPGQLVFNILKHAAERGVDIRIILPAYSDVAIVRRAMRHLYRRLLRHGMRIFEYRPSVVHGKMMCVDDKWTTIGSYNLNHLSDYGSIEFNVEIYNRAFTGSCVRLLNQLIENDCDEITRENYERSQSYFGRITDWLSYHALRLSRMLLHWFIRQDEEN